MNNQTLARILQQHAAELQRHGKSLYRVRAFRKAASAVVMHPRPLEELYAECGRDALESIPGIGAHIACVLERLLRTGEFRPLNDDLNARTIDQTLLGLPGVGPRLVEQLQEAGIDSLEELDRASVDGRLERLGVGPKRLRGLRDVLQVRLNRRDEVPRVSA